MEEPMFKTFDDTDWMGMAGATRFADGSEPLVNYDLKIDGLDACAVIDANGFYLMVMSPDGDTISEIGGEEPFDQTGLLRFLASGKSEWETGELIDMGIAPVALDVSVGGWDR
jgi:hypothetical protein